MSPIKWFLFIDKCDNFDNCCIDLSIFPVNLLFDKSK